MENTTQATPSKADEAASKAVFEKQFNEKCFGLDEEGRVEGGSPVGISRSKEFTQSKYEEVVDILTNWDQDDKTEEKSYRKSHKNGYAYVRKYVVREVTLASGDKVKKLFAKENGKSNRLVLPQRQIFEAIYETHQNVGHLKRTATWMALKQTHANVTQKQVSAFVSLCPVCLEGKPSRAPVQKAATKPAVLYGAFRDRFQIGLIDMKRRQRKNIYGTMMRWLLVLQDHSTQLTYVAPIPRKRPKYIVHELNHIFGLISYPSIFHTDNGKEFTAAEILRMLKEVNPNIATVTGPPRKPNSDQGSIEHAKKLIKKLLANTEAEERQNGRKPNWTMLTGRIMAAANKHESGKGKNATSAYEAVLGMKYDEDLPCTHQELRDCKTVEQRMELTQCPRFHKVAKELCILPEEEGAGSSAECDSEVDSDEGSVDDYWEASSGDEALDPMADDDGIDSIQHR